MYPNAPLKELSDGCNAVNGGSGKAIQLCDNQGIPRLEFLKKSGELRTFHRLAGKGFCDDVLTAVLP